jgi:hypothetical protein
MRPLLPMFVQEGTARGSPILIRDQIRRWGQAISYSLSEKQKTRGELPPLVFRTGVPCREIEKFVGQ